MALQTSGAISLDDIHVEAGGTSGTQASMNDTDIRGLNAATGKTINSTSGSNTDFADYYGAFAFDYTDSSGAVNGAVPDGGPYYTLVTSATTSTVLSAGTYNFVMVGRGGDSAGSASSIALWSITLNGTEAWSWTLGSGTGSTVFTTWQIVGDNTTEVAVRHGSNTTDSQTAVGTKGSSSRITNYAARIGGGGVGSNGSMYQYGAGGGGAVDFFDVADKTTLNGVRSGVDATYKSVKGHGGDPSTPASGTKWLNNLSASDFFEAQGQTITMYSSQTLTVNNGCTAFGGGAATIATVHYTAGNVYSQFSGNNCGAAGFGGGGGYSRHTSLSNPKTLAGNSTGLSLNPTPNACGEPALWYLKV